MNTKMLSLITLINRTKKELSEINTKIESVKDNVTYNNLRIESLKLHTKLRVYSEELTKQINLVIDLELY